MKIRAPRWYHWNYIIVGCVMVCIGCAYILKNLHTGQSGITWTKVVVAVLLIVSGVTLSNTTIFSLIDRETNE